MIKMSELIKQQNDMIRKESGMNVKEENENFTINTANDNQLNFAVKLLSG